MHARGAVAFDEAVMTEILRRVFRTRGASTPNQ